MLRAVKHRFGSTDELGLFEMTGGRAHRRARSRPSCSSPTAAGGPPGSVVVPAMDGRRPLLVEVQSLTVPVPPGVPARRNAQGVDGGRLALLLAVLERRAGVRVADQDVYASVVGGVRLTEPATDLAVGARRGQRGDRPAASREGVVVTGEIGLGGEVRQVAHAKRRLGEAARMGFRAGDRAGGDARRRRHRSWCACARSSRRSARRRWPAWHRRGAVGERDRTP